eukprot:gene2532-2900_t
MDSLLKCPKCLTLYKHPKALDCSHIICLGCLEGLFRPDASPYIDCPLCDKQTLVLNSTIDLPVIAPIEELLMYFSGTGLTEPTLSPRFQRLITTPFPDSCEAEKKAHNNAHNRASSTSGSSNGMVDEHELATMATCGLHAERFRFYCTESSCERLICLECIIDHNGHKFSKIPKEAERRLSDVEQLVVTMAHAPTRLAKQRVELERHLVAGETQHRDTKKRIDDDIGAMVKLLLDRKAALESTIDRDWEEQRTQLTASLARIETKTGEIKLCNKMTSSLLADKIATDKLMLTGFTLSDDTSSCGSEAHPSTADTRQVAVAASLLTKYGELKSLEDATNALCNELIVNIEWKWDPEFQYPQLYPKRDASPSANGVRRRQVALTTPPSMSVSSSQETISKSPGSVSPNPGSASPNPLSSSDMYGGRSGTTSPEPNGLSKSTSSLMHLPRISSNSSMSSVASGSGPSIVVQPPPTSSLSMSTNSMPMPRTSSPPHRAQQPGMPKKNPVFGKLLTRKDSCIAMRKYFLYAIGGEHSQGTVEMYDVQTNKWAYVSSMPTPTSEFAAVHDNSGSGILCFGGKETPRAITRYDVMTNKWAPEEATLQAPRVGHCAVHDGRRYIYILGGTGESGRAVTRFDLVTRTTCELSNMTHARKHFYAFFSGARNIYVIDGYADRSRTSSIEVYDTDTDTWRVVAPVKTPRYMASVSYDGAKYIYIAGGIDRCTGRDLCTVERFDTHFCTWDTLEDDALAGRARNRIQFYNSTTFDGEQTIYYMGINVDEPHPLLYRYNIRTKQLDSLASMARMRLNAQLVIVSK